jgi:hypothetical protein
MNCLSKIHICNEICFVLVVQGLYSCQQNTACSISCIIGPLPYRNFHSPDYISSNIRLFWVLVQVYHPLSSHPLSMAKGEIVQGDNLEVPFYHIEII